jgi:hypothetical protein
MGCTCTNAIAASQFCRSGKPANYHDLIHGLYVWPRRRSITLHAGRCHCRCTLHAARCTHGNANAARCTLHGTCGEVTRDMVLSQVHSLKRLSCRSPVTLDGCRLLSQLGGARLEATLHISLNRPKDVQVECTGLDRLDRAGCLGKREVSHLGHGMSRWPQPKKHAVSKLAYHV